MGRAQAVTPLVAALALRLLLAAPAGAQRAGDTVFVLPGSHLDVGFTAPPGAIASQRIRILDEAIEVASRTRAFTWMEEGGWSVEAWLDHYHDDPMRIARLRTLVARNQISVGATMLSAYAAAFPGALKLLTMHLDRVERELGRRPTVAVVNDVPAIPERFVDMLAAAGIHYLLMGTNLAFTPPLPSSVTQTPFYWESARGARVLVSINPNGYTTALAQWLLPPDCIRFFDPRNFPARVSDDSILSLGVGRQLATRVNPFPLTAIQHALDNGGPGCVANLPAALARWNSRRNVTRLISAIPETYFRHVEQRFRTTLPVLRGEWGGDWDLLRASEPVWSWRLREAINAIAATAPLPQRMAAVMVIDHNVGMGPRWQDGESVETARQHMADVATLYRTVVSGALGDAALTRLPAPMVMPPQREWPAAWRQVVGERRDMARVRAGGGFIYPFVNDSAPDVAVPMTIAADDQRMVIRSTIDRVALERQLGARYQAVIEITLRAPMSAVRLAPDSSPSGRAGRWLLGKPAQRVVAPEGVVVQGPGWTIHAHGPLLIGWTLRPDPKDPKQTRLQALAVVHAVEGNVSGGQKLRLPFAEMYPGEPSVPVFDLELVRERKP